MNTKTKKYNVGILVNTHGLRGEVKVKVLTDFPEIRFAKQAKLYCMHQNEVMELTVEFAKAHKDMLIVKFEDYNDINLVEPWKGSKLFVYENQLQKLDENEAYYHEILNSTVYDLDDTYLGEVVEIIETGANLVLRIEGKDGHILIPFVKAFVKEFDKEKKRMRVELIEGL